MTAYLLIFCLYVLTLGLGGWLVERTQKGWWDDADEPQSREDAVGMMCRAPDGSLYFYDCGHWKRVTFTVRASMDGDSANESN